VGCVVRAERRERNLGNITYPVFKRERPRFYRPRVYGVPKRWVLGVAEC
jgi:hypothetical protein